MTIDIAVLPDFSKRQQIKIGFWGFCENDIKKTLVFGPKFVLSIIWPMSFTEIYEESCPIRRRQMLQLILINFYNKTFPDNLYSEFKRMGHFYSAKITDGPSL